jgi:hypothetical protein
MDFNEFVHGYMSSGMQPTREEFVHKVRSYNVHKKLTWATIFAQGAAAVLWCRDEASGFYMLGLGTMALVMIVMEWYRGADINMHAAVALHHGIQRDYPNGLTIPAQSSVTVPLLFKGECGV